MARGHTAGPWETIPKGKVGDFAIHAEHEGCFALAIVQNGGLDDETKANARLIAAAPELLAACEGVVAALEPLERDGKLVVWQARLLRTVAAAVAKARGEEVAL